MMSELQRALDQRARAGAPVRLWLRDDDAVAPTTALDRLLDMTRAAAVPLTLAVIPAFSSTPLATRLQRLPLVSVAVHGWSHENHAAGGEKKQELGPQRPPATVWAELSRGLAHLRALHGAQVLPVVVPPWNRIAPEVAEGLPALGFRALSVFGKAQPSTALRVVNTHVDLIDWKGTRGGRPEADLVAELLPRVQQGHDTGLLTHHLVHDAAAWTFMERLFAVTSGHPGCRWVSLKEMLPAD
jgi:hypothetical protein